jgi:hypothetical protein
MVTWCWISIELNRPLSPLHSHIKRGNKQGSFQTNKAMDASEEQFLKIKRVRDILDVSGDPPALFCLLIPIA